MVNLGYNVKKEILKLLLIPIPNRTINISLLFVKNKQEQKNKKKC